MLKPKIKLIQLIIMLFIIPIPVSARVDLVIGDGMLATTTGSTKIEISGDVVVNETGYLKGNVTLSGNWVNNGTFNAGNGKVTFNGSGGNQTVTSQPGDTFYDLVINKPSGNVLLEDSITVSDSLSIIGGHLDANGNSIILGGSGTLSETDGNTFDDGTIITTRNLNAPTSDNIGGLGAEITTNSNLGMTTIVRGHIAQTGNGNYSINRYFDIIPTNDSGLNATLIFHYDDSELNGLDESNLLLFNSPDSGSNWIKVGGEIDTNANIVSVSGVNHFSRWTLAGNLAYTGVVDHKNDIPSEFKLYQNFPNPFNPSTKIKYSVPVKSRVVLKVFDITGQEITTLINMEKPAGNYEIEFDAGNLASGIYIYRFEAAGIIRTKKMVLLK